MSDWKDGANKRRDARNTKEPETKQKSKPAKKDTKKWCAGRVGREHTLEVSNYRDTKGWPSIFGNWWVLYCATCGKELDTFHARIVNIENKNYPKWLIDSGKLVPIKED